MSKMYLNEQLVAKALEIIEEIKEVSDVATDCAAIKNILNTPPSLESIQRAVDLDNYLRRKYKTIDALIAVGNSMSQGIVYFPPQINQNNNDFPKEYSFLTQDWFGILADVLLKKAIIKNLEEFIDHIG